MAIKVLVVDDSALMRRQLTKILEEAGGFEVRTARNGQEAIDENLSWQPDVITLDINMPVMDGLTALAHLMATRPVPVVMVSSLTEKGALATFEALALGAVDYIAKPGGTISLSLTEVANEIVAKVQAAARAHLRLGRARRDATRGASPKQRLATTPGKTGQLQPGTVRSFTDGLVLVGVSTGGPGTLELILPKLPADFPCPIVVAQHMPASFTGPFAERLNQLCPMNVVEANRPMTLEPGTVYIGKGGADLEITTRLGKKMVLSKPENPQHLWHPSVEVLGRSALAHWDPTRLIAVMLTGMGYDGADAFAEIKRRGGRTIAESESSAVVFGMPKELIERGGATLVLPADQIARQLLQWVGLT